MLRITRGNVIPNLHCTSVAGKSELWRFEKLRGAKTEIESIQRMLEAGRARLQSDFDEWYDQVLRMQPTARQQQGGGEDTEGGDSQQQQNRTSAWATPPVSAEPKAARPPLTTGNPDADDDIQAFYRAKEELTQLHAKR
jgi:hypothetical protein